MSYTERGDVSQRMRNGEPQRSLMRKIFRAQAPDTTRNATVIGNIKQKGAGERRLTKKGICGVAGNATKACKNMNETGGGAKQDPA